MEINSYIIDNFLDNPDAVRNSALSLNFERKGTFPGLRTQRADKDYEKYIQNKLEIIINKPIKEFVQDSFCFQVCYEHASTWVHKDETDYAGVLYLTPNAPLEAGTGIYTEVAENDFELESAIGNVYNRLALYNGRLLHRSIVAGFGNNLQTGRLTQVFFFNV